MESTSQSLEVFLSTANHRDYKRSQARTNQTVLAWERRKKIAYLTPGMSAAWHTTETELRKGAGFVYIKCQPSCAAFCYYHYCYSQTPLCPLLLLLRKLSQESPSSESSSTTANFQHYMMWKQHHLVSETYQTSRKTHTCYCDLHLSCQTGTSVQTHKDTLELCSLSCAYVPH